MFSILFMSSYKTYKEIFLEAKFGEQVSFSTFSYADCKLFSYARLLYLKFRACQILQDSES